jgi:hypothetical protein
VHLALREMVSSVISEVESPRYLSPFVLESFTSESGKPRLKRAREMLLNDENLRDLGFSSLEEALSLGEELFNYWRSNAEYLVLKKEFVGRGAPKPIEYVAVKCSKRGNDVYERRVKTRLKWLEREMDDQRFFRLSDFTLATDVRSSLLWITLTVDPKKVSLEHAWVYLGKDFNVFMASLRQKYGKISYFRVWEAHESGFPHVHVIMLFNDARFSVFPFYSKDGKLTFRIREKEEISRLWCHGHVDVQAVSSMGAVFTYMKKHQEKIVLGLSGSIHEKDEWIGLDLKEIKGMRTLFLTWLFRKRAFSVSGDFREKILDLISHLHNSNAEGLHQSSLDGEIVVEWIYSLMGIYSGKELGIPSYIWSKKLEGFENFEREVRFRDV